MTILWEVISQTCENFEIWGSRERWSFVLSLPVTKKLNRVGHFVKTSKKQCETTLKIHFHDVNLIEEFKNLDLKIYWQLKFSCLKMLTWCPVCRNNYQQKQKSDSLILVELLMLSSALMSFHQSLKYCSKTQNTYYNITITMAWQSSAVAADQVQEPGNLDI